MRLTAYPLVALVTVLGSGALLASLAACGSDGGSMFDGGGNASSGTSGTSSGFDTDGGELEGGGGGSVGVLEAIVRDFKQFDSNDPNSNPDFENIPADDERPDGAGLPYFGPWTEATATWFPGAEYAIDIVQDTLGDDNLPRYNEAASFRGTDGRTATTHGKEFFDYGIATRPTSTSPGRCGFS